MSDEVSEHEKLREALEVIVRFCAGSWRHTDDIERIARRALGEDEEPADLYDGIYRDSLKGRWRHRMLVTRHVVIVVEGPGTKNGTVACHSESDPEVRQDDLPITTLHLHYEGLR